MTQIGLDVQSVELRTAEQTVDQRRTLAAVVGTGEEPALHRAPAGRLAIGGDLLGHRHLSAARREPATLSRLGTAQAGRCDHAHGRQPAAARLRRASATELTRATSLAAASFPTQRPAADVATSTSGRWDVYGSFPLLPRSVLHRLNLLWPRELPVRAGCGSDVDADGTFDGIDIHVSGPTA